MAVRTKGLLMGLLVGACTGCGGRLETSLEVAEVEANRDAFAQVEDHPLLSVAAGTVIDDLTGLDGCWGAYADKEYAEGVSSGEGGSADVGDVDMYEFYRFDLKEGKLTHQGLIRVVAPFGAILDALSESVYSAEITGPNRITVQLQSIFEDSNAFPADRREFDPAEQDPFDVQITLDADTFKIGHSEEESPASSGFGGFPLVFFRFDCPESNDDS